MLLMNTYYKKRTKIVGTIGPASSNPKTLARLSEAGLNIARLNFSHGDHAEQQEKVELIKEVRKKTGKRLAILQDLSGPKIRTGDLETSSVVLKKGAKLVLTTKKMLGTAKKMSVTYKKLPQDVSVGDRILLNDGKQELKVISKNSEEITCRVVYGGEIKSRRGVNLPDTVLTTSVLTTKDRKDLEFGIANRVDFIAQSFVQQASDITKLKNILRKRGSDALVVAKIETTEAIKNIDEIIRVSDAIMVARGDLAVEVGPERVPMLQKYIVEECNRSATPVIVATQMLESMTRNPVPTRAEVSDVSNAILDGADAIMLSEETAMGEYPQKVVAMMKQIALETEAGIERYSFGLDTGTEKKNVSDAVTHYAVHIAKEVDAKVIVAFTQTGSTMRMLSRFRPLQPILTVSPNEHMLNQTLISFGAYPAHQTKKIKDSFDAITHAKSAVLERKLAKKGDKIVLVSGSIFGKPGESNTVTVVEL